MTQSALIDPCGRPITYLRISVTDKCNFRCAYCMPEQGVELKPHSAMLSYEDIASIVRAAAELGITKIRLTGGEPLVKRNIEFLVHEIACIPGISEVCITSNGALLTPEKARTLRAAGLTRINISLDTLDPAHFQRITRRDSLQAVLDGIDAAITAGLTPIKINMVVFADTTDAEIVNMRSFCADRGLRLQTINHFSLSERTHANSFAADRPTACELCNRIRLTADGHLKPCLFSDDEIPVDLNNIKKSLQRAVAGKPVSGKACTTRAMSQIGG